MTDEAWFGVNNIKTILASDKMLSLGRAVLVMAVAFLLARLARRAAVRLFAPRLRPQQVMLMRRVITYGITGLAASWSLRELGFDIGVLLGAAGVFTVAVGFAAQTSVSNLISGLFLIVEQPFCVGDIIETGNVTGEILSIDLLSVKLRAPENLFVRVPNEALLKSTVINLTRYETRSFNMEFMLELGQDIEHAKKVILRLAGEQPLCLTQPKPGVAFLGYNELAMRLQLTVWTNRTNMGEAKSALQSAIVSAFVAEGLLLPRPYAGRKPTA